MHALLIVLPLLTAKLFAADLDHAFALVQNHDWAAAAAALDQVVAEDPASFAANNLQYLRGRIAENQNDWPRALAEFEKVEPGFLRPLAALHAARAAIHTHDIDRAS